MNKKTKIVATIGPASDTKERLKEMKGAGVNVVRLNFSHGTHESHGDYIDRVNEIREGKEISILQDLPGPKIRVGELDKGAVVISSGEGVIFSTNPGEGDLPVDYENFSNLVESGDHILIDDGTKKATVQKKEGNKVWARVEVGGRISSHKGINLPGVKLEKPAFTEKDKHHLEFGIKKGVDMVAVSFVESAEDIKEVQKFLKDRNASHIKVIAKIERRFAVDDIDNILKVSDGIMVARGDMGLQMAFTEIPFIQKELIKKAQDSSKPVVTATHMLESMVDSPQPTRAEVSDVTNAVLNGTDAVMLSEETAAGNYPVESVEVMAEILKEAESRLPSFYRGIRKPRHVPSAIALSAVEIAGELEAEAIFVLTESGSTARLVSRYRPRQDVYALTPNNQTLAYLNLTWGVRGIKIEDVHSISEARDRIREVIEEAELGIEEGNVVLCAGMPFATPGTTNLVFVENL